MYSPTSSHSPTLKLAKDLAAILLPFKRLLTHIKAGAGAAQLDSAYVLFVKYVK